MPKVRLFSTPICPYCFSLKRFLEEKGIEIEEIDISSDEKSAEEVLLKTKQTTVPVTEIDGEYVVGFDRKRICELLKIED